MNYRLYFQGADGYFIRARDLAAENDDDARNATREIDHAYCIEIWTGMRMVGIVKSARANLNVTPSALHRPFVRSVSAAQVGSKAVGDILITSPVRDRTLGQLP